MIVQVVTLESLSYIFEDKVSLVKDMGDLAWKGEVRNEGGVLEWIVGLALSWKR